MTTRVISSINPVAINFYQIHKRETFREGLLLNWAQIFLMLLKSDWQYWCFTYVIYRLSLTFMVFIVMCIECWNMNYHKMSVAKSDDFIWLLKYWKSRISDVDMPHIVQDVNNIVIIFYVTDIFTYTQWLL